MKTLKGFLVIVLALAVGITLFSTALLHARQTESQSQMQLMKYEADALPLWQETKAKVTISQNQITRQRDDGQQFDISFKSIFEVVRLFVLAVMRCFNSRSLSIKFEPMS
jgi:hypothetical protein